MGAAGLTNFPTSPCPSFFGWLSDLWSREKVFALGFFVFSVSSLLCGLSLNVLQLILSRFVQGVAFNTTFLAAAALSVGRSPPRWRAAMEGKVSSRLGTYAKLFTLNMSTKTSPRQTLLSSSATSLV
jgi:MFS family permease